MNYEDMTHEELASEARNMGLARDNADLVDAGQELQSLVDEEKESDEQAAIVIKLLRA